MRKKEYEQHLAEYLAKKQEKLHRKSLNTAKYNAKYNEVSIQAQSYTLTRIFRDFMDWQWECKTRELKIIEYTDQTGKVRMVRNFLKRS